MSIGLRTNIAAVNAIRRLDQVSHDLSRTFDHLSSGLRITRPSDDAAGLSVGSALKADVRVYAQGVRNINDGVSLLNTAEGALGQLSTIMIRQKELAEQAANGVYSGRQRVAMQSESNALTREFNRIIRSTQFGNSAIIDGTEDTLRIQQGYGSNETTTLAIGQSLGTAAGDGTFSGSTLHSGGGIPYHVNIADINGDGVPDLVASNQNGRVSFYAGQASGGFSAATTIFVSATLLTDYTLRDMNNDGALDIIGAEGANVYIRMGNGNGTFRAAESYGDGSALPSSIAVTDFNGDGVLDVAATGGNNLLHVYLGNQDGSLRASQAYDTGVLFTSWSGGVSTADFNGDGVQDFVGAESGTGGIFVMLGNADGSFSRGQSFAGGTSWYAAVGDLNGDGKVDVMTSDGHVHIGRGDGTFDTAVSYASGGTNGKMVLADMNGDGVLDGLFGAGPTARIMLGNGDGTFRARTTIGQFASGLISSIAVGDLNNDGVPDFIVGDENFGIRTGYGTADSSGRRNNFFYGLDLLTIPNARAALVTTTAVLNRINGERGQIGALQSRLSTSLNNIKNRVQNYDSAASQILDADIAEESATLVSKRIIQQAATAVLSQASKQTEIARVLLGGFR